MRHLLALFLLLAASAASAVAAAPPDTLARYEITAYGNGSTGPFAPYMIGSLNYGKNAQKGAAMLNAKAVRGIDLCRRFSWAFGVEGIAGAFTANDYARWDGSAWTSNRQGPAAARLQQLYAEAKYRGVFITVGMKEHGSPLLNQVLSSGDLVQSGNTRPMPEVRLGFIDFQDIPFTNGWVQIQGELSYAKFMDKAYTKDHFNYYSYHYNLGALYNYKRCFFRTKPSMPLSVTVGMQAATIFGGTSYFYKKGKFEREASYSRSLKTALRVLIPIGENSEDYYTGSSLGSWDLRVRYRLPNGDKLFAYIQWLWEDGSSIGRRNRSDGLWGIEYQAAKRGWITGALLEYVDFRDQSGPVHWAPHITPGTTVTAESTGRDNYYNNSYYNSYAYYGQAIGSPFLISPIYNLDGYPGFACNRANGLHAGVMGAPANAWAYRVLASWQRGLGSYNSPYYRPRQSFSMLFEADWDAKAILRGLSARAQVAFDAGRLRHRTFGTAISITYSGNF